MLYAIACLVGGLSDSEEVCSVVELEMSNMRTPSSVAERELLALSLKVPVARVILDRQTKNTSEFSKYHFLALGPSDLK